MKSIAILGQGFVGGALTTVMSERGFTVYAYDKAGKYVNEAVSPFSTADNDKDFPASVTELITACETQKSFTGVFFVCVPTPMYEDGSADLSIVESVLLELAAVPGKRIAVVKSTVPPGSTEVWNKKFADTGLTIVFSPEFLTEANALNDMRNQDRIVLGGPRPHINRVKQVFQSAFPNVPIIKTSSTNAELVKYVGNCFLATKVAFANEMYQICQKLFEAGTDADYDRVVEIAQLDKRLGTSHWKVPGPMPADDTGELAFGFGGSCFIKDLNALMCTAHDLGVDPKVMSGVWQKNLEVRPNRDWEKLSGRAVSKKKT